MTDVIPERATFTSMAQGTKQDWDAIGRHVMEYAGGHADRVLAHLRLLENDHGGFAVGRLEHSLQTATRAYRDGRDDEYVVCALLHDIGDTLASLNHPDVAAAILWPYVSEENHWMVAHHATFQGYFYFEYLGLDKNARDKFKDHPCYDRTVEFCAEYDGPAFDPSYKSLALEEFEPAVRAVFASARQSGFSR